ALSNTTGGPRGLHTLVHDPSRLGTLANTDHRRHAFICFGVSVADFFGGVARAARLGFSRKVEYRFVALWHDGHHRSSLGREGSICARVWLGGHPVNDGSRLLSAFASQFSWHPAEPLAFIVLAHGAQPTETRLLD